MDVLKFLQEGNVKNNPEYNPKTKKGREQAPLLVDYNVGESTKDKSKEIISNILARSSYDLTKYADKNYADYNVYINPINTEEELNKERAKHQSAIEQLGRLTAQVVGSEVVLGTLRGFSDLADAGYNFVANKFKEEGEKDSDYTNPISQALADAQEAYRERFEIYKENTEEAFDFGDFGWWTGGAVSIASTLSLLIPGTALSKVGKLAGIGKLGKGIGKIAGKTVGKSARWGKIGEETSEIMTTALGSRVAENYIEARDVYTQTYDKVKTQLDSMTNADKEKFFNRHPRLKDLSNKDIAKYLAGESADNTFKGDMWLMLMDVAQLKSLKNFWVKSPSVNASGNVIEKNIQTSARLIGTDITKLSKKGKIANWIKNNYKNIGAELTEGVEEGWQYYQQQYGIDKARNVINDEYKVRSLADNLKDPMLWESAFWGWLGGIAFQGIASKSKQSFDKYVLKNKNTTEEARIAEIENRQKILSAFDERMKLLDEGFDPDSPLLDDEGKPLTDDSGNPLFKEIDKYTAEAYKESATDKLITDLTLKAANAGNYDLLKEWLTNDNFRQYVENSNTFDKETTKSFLDNIATKMDAVYETYSNEVEKVANNDIINPGIIERIATENTYNKLSIDEQAKIKSNYQEEIDKAINNINNDTIKQHAIELEKELSIHGVKVELDNLAQQDKDNNTSLKKKEINKLEHRINKNRIQNIRETFLKNAGYNSETEFNTAYSEIDEYKSNMIELNAIDSNLGLNIVAKQKAERTITLLSNYINDTNTKIKNRAKVLDDTFKHLQGELYQDELDKLNDIFENNNINEVVNYLSGDKNVKLNDETKSQLDEIEKSLNIFAPGSETVIDIISELSKHKEKEKRNKPKTNINGQGTNVDLGLEVEEEPIDVTEKNKKTEIKTEIKTEDKEIKTEDKEVKADTSPSTGELTAQPKIDEEGEIDKGVEKALELEAKASAAVLNPSFIVSNVLRKKLFDKDSDLKNKSYNEQYDEIKKDLLLEGLTEQDIDDNLGRELKSMRFMMDKLKSSGLQLSAVDTVIAKVVTTLNEDKTEYYKRLIELYAEKNNILTSDGISYFNIINLMKFVIKETNISFETINTIYEELTEYIRNNKINNGKVIDSNSLYLNRDNLYELLNKKEEIDVTDDNRVGIVYNDSDKIQALSILNKLKVGDKLNIKINTKGVEFYSDYVNDKSQAISTKIGFLYRPERTNNGNGYIVENGNLIYTLEYNGDEYTCSLDEIFDKLNPANGTRTEEDNKFISLLYNINNLTDEDYTWFYNSSYGKFLYTLYNNKNANAENAKKVLRYIKGIYMYKESDNFDENYNSYVQFLAKQYNNFKMTDDIYNMASHCEITVKSITKGKVLFDNSTTPKSIDEAIANFNYNDFHLQIIPISGEIEDVVTRSRVVKAGFNRTNMLIAIPNGTNEPHYSKIIPQSIDINKGIGKDIYEEVINLIDARQNTKISYEELRDKLLNIFGFKNFINGINCIEYENKIIIASAGSKIPAITIYKYKSKSNEKGLGITINPTEEYKKGASYNGLSAEAKSKLVQTLTNLFNNATFSMSYGIATRESKNPYIKFNDDGSFETTFNNKTTKYNNYLEYIIKNKAGKIRLDKVKIGNEETNFSFGAGTKAAKQLKIEYRDTSKDVKADSSPVEDKAKQQRDTAIDNLAKNATDVPIKSILDVVASDKNINESLIKALFPDKIDIDLDAVDENTGKPIDAYASYNKRTKKFKLYRKYFELAKSSSDKAVRTLIHEELHRKFDEAGFKQSQKFINEMTLIMQEFADALNNIDKHSSLVELIAKNNYDKESYINQLRQFIDPNNPAYKDKTNLYILEEFVVESLTNKDLYEALNNIYSGEIKAETKRPTLWQKIINWIREVFGFEEIKDNSLLAKEFKLFAKNFNKDNKIETKPIIEEKVDIEEETKEEIKEKVELIESPAIEETPEIEDVEEVANNITDEDIINEDEDEDLSEDDLFESAVDTDIKRIYTPSMSAVKANLNASERLLYDDSLARGEINFACR